MKYTVLRVFNEEFQDHLTYGEVEAENLDEAIVNITEEFNYHFPEEDIQDVSNEAGVEGRAIVDEDTWIVANTKNDCRIIYAVIQERES